MLIETLIWALSWLPPAYVGWSVARRLGVDGHLRPMVICLGAILHAYAACLVCILPFIGMRPATVLTASTVGALILLVLDLRGRRRGVQGIRIPRVHLQFRADLILPAVSVACVAGLLAWLFWLGMRLPPHFSDACAVHSAPALTWYADKRFSWPVEGLRDETFDAVNGYLRLPHFLFYYNVVAAGDSGFMSMGQFEGLLLLLAAVWAICIELGTGRRGAVLACSACLSISEMLVEVLDCYLDVLVAATLAASLLGALLLLRNPTLRRLAGFSLLSAVAIAVKATSLVQVGPVWFLVLLWACFRLRRERRRDLFACLAVSLLVMLVVGGSWYLACWLRFGNPLYPFRIQVFGKVLAPGLASDMAEQMYLGRLHLNRWTALAYSWNERMQEYSLGAPFAGLGPLFAIVGVPSLMILVLQSANRRNVLRLVWFATALAMVFLHPSFWQPRYSILVAVVGCVAIATVSCNWGVLMRSAVWLLVLAGMVAGLARALPYQISGHLMPMVYWKSSLQSVELTHLAAFQIFPDANPIRQRLLLSPEFSGKRILVDSDTGIGGCARRRMDSRLFHNTARSQPQFLRDVLDNRIDYVYCREGHPYRGSGVFAAMRQHPALFREQAQQPLAMRLATDYYCEPGVEHLFTVNREAVAAMVKGLGR